MTFIIQEELKGEKVLKQEFQDLIQIHELLWIDLESVSFKWKL